MAEQALLSPPQDAGEGRPMGELHDDRAELDAYDLFDDYLHAEIKGDKTFLEDHSEILAEKLDDSNEVGALDLADLWADAESDSETQGGADISHTTGLLKEAIDKRVAAYTDENGKDSAEEFLQGILHEKEDYLEVLRAKRTDGEGEVRAQAASATAETEVLPLDDDADGAEARIGIDSPDYTARVVKAMQKVRALEAEAAKDDPAAPELDYDKLDDLLDRLFPATVEGYEEDKPSAEPKQAKTFRQKVKHAGQVLLKNTNYMIEEIKTPESDATEEEAKQPTTEPERIDETDQVEEEPTQTLDTAPLDTPEEENLIVEADEDADLKPELESENELSELRWYQEKRKLKIAATVGTMAAIGAGVWLHRTAKHRAKKR